MRPERRARSGVEGGHAPPPPSLPTNTQRSLPTRNSEEADLHALVAVRRLGFPSIIRLRREGCRAEEVVRIFQPVLFRYEAQLLRSCLISVKERQTTIRRLPIEPG